MAILALGHLGTLENNGGVIRTSHRILRKTILSCKLLQHLQMNPLLVF